MPLYSNLRTSEVSLFKNVAKGEVTNVGRAIQKHPNIGIAIFFKTRSLYFKYIHYNISQIPVSIDAGIFIIFQGM